MLKLRLLPIVMISVGGLLLLKALHMAYTVMIEPETTSSVAEMSPGDAEEPDIVPVLDRMLLADASADTPLDEDGIDPIVTGQVDGEGGAGGSEGQSAIGFQLSDGFAAAAARRADALRSSRRSDSNVREVFLGQDPESELAILERLSERRKELEARNDELSLRENLLQAAEKRIEDRIGELQRLEDQIEVKTEQRDEEQRAQLKSLVQMYESMKPKNAAEIFNRLDMDILVRVVEEMQPRRMSAVMAKMSPDVAKRLTTAIALRSLNQPSVQDNPQQQPSLADLPKIQGQRANGG